VTTAIPTAPAELEEFLADRAKVEAVMNEGRFKDLIVAYAKNVQDKDADLGRQIQEETQRVLAEWLRENEPANVKRLNLNVGDPVRHPRNTIHNPKAMGAAVDGLFDSSGDYFRSIWHGADRSPENETKLRQLRNAFSSSVPSEGGFLIPETLRSEILRVSLETSIVRPRARVVPMETLRVPFPAIDATSNASSVYGGIVGYWTEEGGTLTASQAAFRRVVLDAKKLTAYTEVPNELFADAPAFGGFIDQIFPEALGFYEDYAFLRGGGVGEPLGIHNSGAVISVTKETGQAADTIVWENVVKMFARMLPSSLNRAVWVASIDTFPELATMALSVGTGGAPVWLSNGAAGPPMTILGRPVIFTEKLPTLGDAGDIYFVDFGFYLIGDRQAMSAMSSEHFKFSTDVTAFRIIERVDGRPWVVSAITPKNSGNTLSPIVRIAERA